MKNFHSHPLLKGAFILTCTGLAGRLIGFFYRIFLSGLIGAEGLGIYQLIFPVYALCVSFCAIGIQTAISRFTASYMAVGDEKGALRILQTGLSLSLFFAFLCVLVLRLFARPVSVIFLQESRCEDLLKIIAFILPFAAIHSCINGYYFGLKQTGIPAVSQFIEQLVRITATWLLWKICLEKGIAVTPALAVTSLVIEEGISSLFCIIAVSCKAGSSRFFSFRSFFSFHRHGKDLLLLSAPLTLNRVILNLLQSIEALCIPGRLRLYGLSVSESLSVYGVLTGMTLPLLLFPSAITMSLSTMLLPAVSEAQASHNSKKIASTVQKTVSGCLILGIFCTGLFFFWGKDLGRFLFRNNLCGSFLLTLSFICPFLYLSGTLSSILNGLGKTSSVFRNNLLCISVRIAFLYFLIPVFGIQGFLWGFLVSQLLLVFFHFHTLKQECTFQLDAFSILLKPAAAILLAYGISCILRVLLLSASEPLSLLASIGAYGIFYLFFLILWKIFPFPKNNPSYEKK
ncbi:MAG: polysaccharide biosynthesis protein [Oscillospiraceae bacterium]|nr:polysaccharide biosynthesis protein [Oscillospiraceae bacterium]